MANPLRQVAINLHQDIVSSTKDIPVDTLESMTQEDIQQICKEKIDGQGLLQTIVAKNRADILQLLLQKGLNLKEFLGNEQLLHVAIKYKSTETARMLVKQGADLSIIIDGGKTVLHLAAEAGLQELTRYLIDHGCVPILNNVENSGLSPLALACMCGKEETMDILLKSGAKVNSNVGIPPLHAACLAGKRNMHIIRVLIEQGANVNLRDQTGCTPLHFAAYKDQKQIVQLLLQSGANVLLQNGQGKRPLQLAKSPDIKEILLAAH